MVASVEIGVVFDEDMLEADLIEPFLSEDIKVREVVLSVFDQDELCRRSDMLVVVQLMHLLDCKFSALELHSLDLIALKCFLVCSIIFYY